MKISLIVMLFLMGCSQPYVWGTVVGITEDTGEMGCFGDISYATIKLDDGRVTIKCMEVPIGTRVQVCYGDYCSNPRPDPLEQPNE